MRINDGAFLEAFPRFARSRSALARWRKE